MKPCYLTLLICLLLAGCAGSVQPQNMPPTVSPTPVNMTAAATPTPREELPTPNGSTPFPMDAQDGDLRLPIATPPSHYQGISVRKVTLKSQAEPFYLAGTELCPAGELTRHAASLSGGRWTRAQVEALGAAIAKSEIPLKELPAALSVFGLETEGACFAADEAIVGWECTEVFQGEYLHVSLEIDWYSGHVSLFFQRAGEGYIPWSLVDYATTEVGGYDFLRFAGQPFMVYAFGGGGSGYHNNRAYWYNLSTRAVELCYMYSFHDEYNVAENVFQSQDRIVLEATPVENTGESYVELSTYLRLGAVYQNKTEGGDVLQYAPEPDVFAVKVSIRLFYDQAANAFYLRIPPEAYPLYSETDKAVLCFYFCDQLQDLQKYGNDYQKRWGATFYRDDKQ